ncbi:MAG: DUF4386 domain-containing protein [Sphingomonadaceae bacterium]|nr:DUF4386 domain-containing protein [Sphingomonadaceae bacterium]
MKSAIAGEGSGSPNLKARIAGGLWILVILAGMFAEAFVRSRLIVHGDAAATAQRIMASEFLYRLGIVADLVGALAYAGVSLLLYQLLRPVSRSVSLFAVSCGLAGSVVMVANLLTLFAPLVFLGGGSALSGLDPQGQQAMATASLRLHAIGYNLSMVFFALQVSFLGYLVLRSAFLPHILGALLGIEGACNLLNSLAIFLFPAFADHLYPYILMPGLAAEGGLALWLLTIGVNVREWREQAGVERRS